MIHDPVNNTVNNKRSCQYAAHRRQDPRIDHIGDPDQNDISEFPAPWQRFANEAAAEHFTGLSDRITEARKQTSFNVNFQAVIEQLLLAFIGEQELWVK